MEGFAGKVAVVTGAGSGIGQALAVELGRSGASLAISDVDIEWRARFDDLNGFRADHGHRHGEIDVAADRLPTARQHQMAVLDGAFDDVGCADELRNKTVSRREVNITRRPDLGDRAFLHDDNAISELHGFGLIMRDIDCCDAKRTEHPVQLAAQAIA